MKTQTYYHTPLEGLANICDMTKELRINCVGAVDDSVAFASRSVRKDYYMMYLTSGSMNIEFDGTKSIISAGELLIMRPGTAYFYYAEKGSGIGYLWLHFTGNRAEETVQSFSVPINRICSCGQVGSAVECWKKMFYEFVRNDRYFEKMTASLFTEILILFSRGINNPDRKKHLLKSVLYIHENYQKKLHIADLASMENVSESHYRTVFTRRFGESPLEYITARRVEAAMELLENTDKTLSEIAVLIGYNDAYYFGRQFKRKTGISPGRYRRQITEG